MLEWFHEWRVARRLSNWAAGFNTFWQPALRLDTLTTRINFGGGTHDDDPPDVFAVFGVNRVQCACPEFADVTVHDVRPLAMALDEHSFTLVGAAELRERCDATVDLNFYDAATVVQCLYPRVEQIVQRECPGATRCIAFDHVIRDPDRIALERRRNSSEEDCKDKTPQSPVTKREPRRQLASSQEADEHELLGVEAEPNPTPRNRAATTRRLVADWRAKCECAHRTPFLQSALMSAHGDYTARSGRARAEQLLKPFCSGETLERLLAQRFAIVNLWYPLERVQSNPLAICTWQSVGPRDVRTNRLTFTHRVGETYKVCFHKRQRWCYYSGMGPTEALLMKTYDSSEDVARFCLHSSFALPEQVERASRGMEPLPARRSMEVRVLVLYGAEEEEVRNFVPPHMIPGAAEATEVSSLLRQETCPRSQEW